MTVKPYPTFETVFSDKKLKGIFYPLCSVSNIDGIDAELFVVSTNGLWIDENFKNEFASFNFMSFHMIDKKYHFNGDIRLFKGSDKANELYQIIETDFHENGHTYLSEKMKERNYVAKMKQELSTDFGAFDIDYFLENFYSFSINKLNYELTGKFGAFREIIDGWGTSDAKFLYDKSTNDFQSCYKDIESETRFTVDLEKIGLAIGFHYFTDGNDTLLLYDNNAKTAYCINHYS
jgi:hypothetical protein